MDRLILFDIDGTLTRTQNGYIPFNEAVRKTFGIAGDIRSVIPDGNTDPLIVEEIFASVGVKVKITSEQWHSFGLNLGQSYAQALKDGRTRISALPGVSELVAALAKSEGVTQGIVTGNLKNTAELKLKAAGLDGCFALGAYASDSRNRIDLPGIARERWEKIKGGSVAPENCVIVGDTPKDLEAARKSDMKCLLVATGRFSVEQLTRLKPDACVADFTDTTKVVGLLRNLS